MSSPLDPMSPPPVSNPTTVGGVARAAGQAAVGAVTPALIAAATNAAKGGISSSEFKATLGGLAAMGLLAALHVFSVVPGPWMVPALGISTAVTVAAYAVSRGTVKAAALRSAADVVLASSQSGQGVP